MVSNFNQFGTIYLCILKNKLRFPIRFLNIESLGWNFFFIYLNIKKNYCNSFSDEYIVGKSVTVSTFFSFNILKIKKEILPIKLFLAPILKSFESFEGASFFGENCMYYNKK